MAKPKLVYPYPVAIGTFSDGRELRMSIAQEQGRPVDASRAERVLRGAAAPLSLSSTIAMHWRGPRVQVYAADHSEKANLSPHKNAEQLRAEKARAGQYCAPFSAISWHDTVRVFAPAPSSAPLTLAFSGETAPATRPARKSAKTRIDDRVSDLLAACRTLLANSSALDPLDTLRAAVAAFEE